MGLIGIGSIVGLTSGTFLGLIKGEATLAVASKFGTTASNLQDFVDGHARVEIASTLGTTRLSAQELRDSIGKQGAIGLIIGFLIKNQLANKRKK